jgi:hypothetical protein
MLEMPEAGPSDSHTVEEGPLACAAPMASAAPMAVAPAPEKELDMRRAPRAPAVIEEYYRQPRYATGQLFVGNVVTSLVVNTYFNASLWELVHQMIKAEVVMVRLPSDWEGKSYYEYFDKLLREDELMAVAIYRRASAHKGKKAQQKKGRRWSYVFTAPPAKETHMQRGDKVICFGKDHQGGAAPVRQKAQEEDSEEEVGE